MAIANLVVRISADVAAFEKNIKAVERTLERSGKQWESVGKNMTKGLTLPILAIAGVAAKAAIDFESSFAGVRKTVDATEAQFKELEGQFRDLAKTMPLSVDAINKVAESAGQLGVKRESIKTFTETMVQLGATTNLTADEAATAMAKFANALGQPDIDIKKLGASLVALGNAGASTEKSILELAGRLAGSGAQIGLSAGSIFGIANALSSVGIEAEKGGSAFSRLFNDLKKAVSSGGVELENFARVAGRSGEVFANLFKKDSAAAITLFVEGLSNAKANGDDLLKVLDALDITELRYRDTVLLAANAGKQFAESIRLGNKSFDEGKALQEEYNKRLQTTQSQLILLKNNAHDVAITLGQAFLPVINDALTSAKPLVDALAGMAKAFGDLPKPIQNATFAFVGLLAAIGPIAYAVAKIELAWAGFLKVIRFVPVAIAGVSTVFLALVAGMTGVGTGVTGLTGVMFLLEGALVALSSTAGLVVIALGGIALSLSKAIDGVKNMNTALSTGRFWEFVTTKDAPAIWEREFFGLGNAAKGAAVGIRTVTTEAALVDAAARQAAAGMEFAGNTAADTAEGMDRLAAGANGVAKSLTLIDPEETKRKAKELAQATNQLAEEMKNLRDELSGAKLQSEVKKLDAAFTGLTQRGLLNAASLGRIGDAAEDLRSKGARLTPQLLKQAEASVTAAQGLDAIRKAVANLDARVGDVADTFEDDLSKAMKLIAADLQQVEDRVEFLGEAFEHDLVRGMKAVREEVERAAERIEFLDETFKGLSERSQRLRDALYDIGLNAAHGIAEGIADGIRTGDWSQTENNLKAVLSNVMANVGAAVVDFFAPGLGQALKPLFQALSDKLLGALGLGTRGRDLVKEFAESFGGFDALRRDLDRLGAEGERLWKRLTQGTGRDNPEQAQANIDAVREALDAFGTEAERAAKRLEGIGTAIEGVNKKAQLFADPFRKLLEARDKLKSDPDSDPLQIDEINAKLAEMGQRGQAEFERIGTFAAAAFAGMVKETGDALGAIQSLTPAFTVLQQGVTQFGLESTGTIDKLLGLFNLVNDAVTGPIIQSIQATGQIFAGLQAGGLVTSDIFQTVATDIGNAFRDLEAKGGDVAGAMALSQPILQKLWEGQQLYGQVTDDTTQKILDQAHEQGLVGAHMKDVNQKILDVLIIIADVFGADIPDALRGLPSVAKTAADGIKSEFESIEKEVKINADEMERSLRDIKVPPIKIPIQYDDPGFSPRIDHDGFEVNFGGPRLARGGIVRRPTLALIGEAGPEAVVPLSHMGTVAQPGSSTVILEVDGRMFAEVIVPHLPGAVRRRVHA